MNILQRLPSITVWPIWLAPAAIIVVTWSVYARVVALDLCSIACGRDPVIVCARYEGASVAVCAEADGDVVARTVKP